MRTPGLSFIVGAAGAIAVACAPADTTEEGTATAGVAVDATASPGLEGVWNDVGVAITTPDSSWASEIALPSVLIFTDGHYAVARINGAEPRELLGDEPTDEELLAAFRRVRMNGGTYQVVGSAMTTTPIVHWNPNAVANATSGTSAFEVEGDMLRRTFTNDDTGSEFVVTYERYDEAAATEVDGVWDDVELQVTGPDSSFSRQIDSPSVIILSRGHFVVARVAGAEPREMWPEDGPTDEQRLAAMRRLRGSGGTFTAADGTITTTPLVHWHPNAMAAAEPGGSAYELDGDVMWRTFTNEETGTETRVKFVRRQ